MLTEKASFTSRDPGSVAIDKLVPFQNDVGKPSKKASFHARDPAPLTSDTSKSNKKKYMGEERRRSNRRKGQSRRADVRFDPTKTDRRQANGRREHDASVKFW
jgi:hypothetical protein